MDNNKCKSVTTSVPSISIKFHANAEQLEEIHTDEDETKAAASVSSDKSSKQSNRSEPEGSPLKYFPKLVKRSTSIDVSQQQSLQDKDKEKQNVDASPPSDPWRFFSDIKGKITKSVEERITEMKCKKEEDCSGSATASPKHHNQETSSVSDSEDLSESSISKTCGMVSTTEGVEMSSDEDTPSIDKDKEKKESTVVSSSFRQRFRFLRSHKHSQEQQEGSVNVKDLSKLYNINMEKVEQVLPEDEEDVESAVDALEEAVDGKSDKVEVKVSNETILKAVVGKYDNITIDDDVGDVIRVTEVSGKEIREDYFHGRRTKTIFAPAGFVDLRWMRANVNEQTASNDYRCYLIVFISICVYYIINCFSPFLSGLVLGVVVSYLVFKVYVKVVPAMNPSKETTSAAGGAFKRSIKDSGLFSRIFEIQAVKEYQPLLKYEGWINEYPDAYDPSTYHVSKTQSAFVRLQGNLLRLSNSKCKVPKRRMWNEPEIKATFTHHRIYNIIGAKVTLLPQGLAKKRHWSKKYPICITLAKEQMNFDPVLLKKIKHEMDDKDDKVATVSPKDKKRFRRKDYNYSTLAQKFSKLNDDEDFDLDSDSRASTPSPSVGSDVGESPPLLDEDERAPQENEEAISCSPKHQDEENEGGLKLYLFARTDREKEDWFRRFCTATHKDVIGSDGSDAENKENITEMAQTEHTSSHTDVEYIKFMSSFQAMKKSARQAQDGTKSDEQQEKSEDGDTLWLNTLLGRVLFDCVRGVSFTQRVKERIQRKLSTIKLPYFIEELLITELSLGRSVPMIGKAGKPVLDERGVWVDLDVDYEGSVLVTLQTKLNLMRLKNPQAYEKSMEKIRSAIYHSDVDDSAESSSDDDFSCQEVLQQSDTMVPNSGSPAAGGGGGGKKFIKMVDRLAESKFFQAATENRYIKKAMEGVSNTELRLTVEVKSVRGTVVLNVPAPPTDRIWVGFRPLPEIVLSVTPIVGERNISYYMVTSWIEKKLLQEFQKILVLPNMEDFVIPVMNPKLPE